MRETLALGILWGPLDGSAAVCPAFPTMIWSSPAGLVFSFAVVTCFFLLSWSSFLAPTLLWLPLLPVSYLPYLDPAHPFHPLEFQCPWVSSLSSIAAFMFSQKDLCLFPQPVSPL